MEEMTGIKKLIFEAENSTGATGDYQRNGQGDCGAIKVFMYVDARKAIINDKLVFITGLFLFLVILW
jgi:hypothetical protein